MKSNDPSENLRATVASLTQKPDRSWAEVGHLLDQVELTGYWQTHSASFSEWLRSFASSLGLGEASLWRYMASARYYQKLRETLTGRGVACPHLEELPGNVSPENLELLAKLARVAPDDVLQEIAARVVNGSMKRAEMRRTWEAYRPALGGRTARGTGIDVPMADLSDPEQFLSIVEARVFTALTASGSAWTGLKKPHIYEVFHRVAPEFDQQVRQRFEFDAVAVTCAKKSAATEYHGIEVRGSNLLHATTLELLERQRPYCHYLWLALDERSQGSGDYVVPNYVGLLVAHGKEVRVLRRAERNGGEMTGDLAKALLLKTMRR